MSEVITNKQYPIQLRWIFKKLVNAIIITGPSYALMLFIFTSASLRATESGQQIMNAAIFYGTLFIITALVLGCIILLLKRLTFHYAIDEKFLTADQGIIAKRKSHIPYFRIQHVIVRQDFWDRILGIASVAVENASQGEGVDSKGKAFAMAMVGGLAGAAIHKQAQRQVDIIGFNGNKLGMPGLSKADAEKVKAALLERIQQSMMAGTASGL